MHIYTQREVNFLIEHASKGVLWLANALDLPENSVRAALKNRGIKTGRARKFQKGNTPWNKGVKGSIPSNSGSFKKGQTPHNALENGTITIRKSKEGRPYKFIRIAKGKWKQLHRHLWEQSNGSVPKGKLLIFKDGDSLNCALHNLECITKAENAQRNVNYEKASASMLKVWKKIKMMESNGLKHQYKLNSRRRKQEHVISINMKPNGHTNFNY